jgi:hypothetical protein
MSVHHGLAGGSPLLRNCTMQSARHGARQVPVMEKPLTVAWDLFYVIRGTFPPRKEAFNSLFFGYDLSQLDDT